MMAAKTPPIAATDPVHADADAIVKNRCKKRVEKPAIGIIQRLGLAAANLVVAATVLACSQPGPQNPTPLAATSTVASSPSPSPAVATASATVDAGGTATVQATANATTTTQIQQTVIARAVESTVTAQVQSLATAATLSVQQTATAAAQSPVAATATSTTASASPSPAAAACPVQLVRGFGLLYTTNATLASRLGCGLNAEVGSPSITQMFENGLMFWMAREIFVLRTKGASWSTYVDNYQIGQPLPTPTVVAPPNRFTPVGSLGLVWEQQSDVRSQIGWAKAPEQDFTTGAEQRFAHGRMFWTPNKIIYVLYDDNSWQSFPDTFQG